MSLASERTFDLAGELSPPSSEPRKSYHLTSHRIFAEVTPSAAAVSDLLYVPTTPPLSPSSDSNPADTASTTSTISPNLCQERSSLAAHLVWHLKPSSSHGTNLVEPPVAASFVGKRETAEVPCCADEPPASPASSTTADAAASLGGRHAYKAVLSPLRIPDHNWGVHSTKRKRVASSAPCALGAAVRSRGPPFENTGPTCVTRGAAGTEVPCAPSSPMSELLCLWLAECD